MSRKSLSPPAARRARCHGRSARRSANTSRCPPNTTFLRQPPACSSVHIAERRCSFSFRISLTYLFSQRGLEMRGGISVELFRGGCCTRSEIFTPNIHKAWASVKLWVADINKNGKPPAGLQCLDWTALPPSWDRDLLGIADESHRRWHVDPPRQWIKE